ncbi:MAG TPA: hypothetical protein DEO68_11445 [Halomonas campaniensis]|uniref:Uncharacterized protein n=1 Tax=Halomonas campaniensis TaxID=213554 RepID=A0A3D0KHK4_9GAMM|nr:hypothetical protein [Halomonas campaniensis]HCA02770.1 hypothetical protein [Halomonas campaniensis]
MFFINWPVVFIIKVQTFIGLLKKLVDISERDRREVAIEFYNRLLMAVNKLDAAFSFFNDKVRSLINV